MTYPTNPLPRHQIPPIAGPSDTSQAQAQVQAQVFSLPNSSKHAVPTKQLRRNVDGEETEVVVMEYEDRTLVLVTQIGRIGYLCQAAPHSDSPYMPLSSRPFSSGFDDEDEGDDAGITSKSARDGETSYLPSPTLVQTPLLGSPPVDCMELYRLYVSFLHSILRPGTGNPLDDLQQKDLRPVIVGLGLTRKRNDDDDDGGGGGVGAEWENNVEELAEEERVRFLGIMELVKDCQGQR